MLFCVIVHALLALMAMGILNTLSIRTTTTAAIEDNEKAAYLAQAGTQHAFDILERRPGWTGKLKWDDRGSSLHPETHVRRYQVEIRAEANGDVTVFSTGRHGNATKVQLLTLETGNAIP